MTIGIDYLITYIKSIRESYQEQYNSGKACSYNSYRISTVDYLLEQCKACNTIDDVMKKMSDYEEELSSQFEEAAGDYDTIVIEAQYDTIEDILDCIDCDLRINGLLV